MRSQVISKAYNHITLAEAKTHARVHPNFLDDDTYLAGLIITATDTAEKYIQNHIAATTIKAKEKTFTGKELTIMEGNFQAITSISYLDKNGAAVDLLAADYEVEAEEFYFRIFLKNNISAAKDLEINFTTGFTAASIPPVIKQAVLIKLVDFYDTERGSYTSGTFQLNKAFESLLNYHRKILMF